jgi:ORF6N domain
MSFVHVAETAMAKGTRVIPQTRIENRIYLIRDHRVMLDFHLANLYGVETKVLNQAVTRNLDRFPEDFMFRLTTSETLELNRSQIVTGSQKHRDPRAVPRVFTQEGVAMLSSVLRSKRAIEVNIAIMRTFARMREAMISHKDLARRINDMERKYDGKFQTIFEVLRRLVETPEPKKRRIGYIHSED